MATNVLRFQPLVRSAALLLATAVAGCHGSAPTGQVIARVAGEEVTSAQLQQLLDRQPGRQDAAVRATTAQSLIDETLFASEAEHAGLQKDPRIAREIDSARRSILAQAFLRKIAPPSTVTEADISRYYQENAATLGNRRRYVVIDMVVRGGDELNAFVKPLGETLTLEELAHVLQTRRIPAQTKSFSFVSDAVSPRMAEQFARLSVGSNYSFREGPDRHFGRIEQIQSVPVSQAEATNAIRGAILSKRIEQAARDKLAALRAEGKVEMGELGKTILAEQSKIETFETSGQGRPPTGSDDERRRAIERGLRGL